MHDSGGFLFWIPLLYISIFLSLDKKKALPFSLVIHTVSAATAVFAFIHFDYQEDITRILLNFFISQYVFIFALFYIQELFKVYLINQELEQIASTDHLTSLPNRRKIDDILTKQFEDAIPGAFSIILLDIDHFKSINDTHGHDVGDNVLKEISSLLKKYKQETYFFGRWGGEEFILILTGDYKPEEEAERIRLMIGSHSFTGVELVTASFGATTYTQGDDKHSLLTRADAALYQAKENGRNQVQSL
ncbi:GGDEF domain-containing protein [Peribacillus glennii]|uniref:GGDEF domain-containing protein n=1 Tax=Peribacillus glennii TaxID=2303991 RepID=A0A372LEI1_9BACI|nr:GGDEF domain-containing protein [Peribacillus glennii]RFU63710.1 GGDEF domain-containing protein [Peribacillus glennii]